VISNWAGNVQFTPTTLIEPTSVADLQRVVGAAPLVRALGTGHSFNRIADSDGALVSVRRLPTVLDIDSGARTARVSAGLRYGEIGAALQSAGLALPNTGSLPHISIAGACATGTHGSGIGNPILGRIVRAMTFVAADGSLVSVDRESTSADFDGYVLSLGRIGTVTELVLDVVPTFDISQSVILDVDDAVLAERLQEILTAAYSVSVFTTWGTDGNRVWLKQRVDAPRDQTGLEAAVERWGGRLADVAQHPVPGLPGHTATEQLGVPGPWNERLPHFRMDFVPSSGDELQSEYLLPFDHAAEAYAALSDIRDLIGSRLLVGEIRCVAGDSMWLSTTGGRDCIAFHFTWTPGLTEVLPVVAEIERRLDPWGARPHWGKVFARPATAFADLYPRLGDFRRLVAHHDPAGTFGSALVDEWIGLPPTEQTEQG
jgi:alditol oxidase